MIIITNSTRVNLLLKQDRQQSIYQIYSLLPYTCQGLKLAHSLIISSRTFISPGVNIVSACFPRGAE